MGFIEKHKQRKSEIIDLLRKTHSFYKEFGDEDKCDAIDAHIESLEKGTFSIVVVGQFSAGKSTFLNALMGERILPSFTRETTATINFLRSIKESPTHKPLIEVHYRDGKVIQEEDVCLTNIEKYVSTNGDNIAQNVDFVNLFVDSPFLEDGVTLVDSPGLNGVLAHHEDITKRQIDSSHASIFMFSASAPGQASDYEILKMLKQRCSSIIIVLNRIDEIKKDEDETVESVIEKLKENYHKLFPDDSLPEIIPVSAFQALIARNSTSLEYYNRKIESESEKQEFLERSRISGLEDRLMRYLTQSEKTIQEFLAPIDKIKGFLNDTQTELQESIETLRGEIDKGTLQEEINQLEEEIKTLDASVKEQGSGLRNGIDNLIEEAKDTIKSSTRDLKMRSLNQINSVEDLDEFETDSNYYINRLNSSFLNCYETAIEKMQRSFKNLVHEQFDTLTGEVENRLNKSMASQYELQKFDITLDSDKLSLDIDLDDLLEKKAQLMSQLIDADTKIEDAEQKIATADKNDRYREILEKQLADNFMHYSQEVSGLGSRPVAEKRIGYKEHKRGGISGWFKKMWSGNHPIEVAYEYYDSSHQNTYDQDKREIQQRYALREKELNEKINSITDTDSSVYANLVRRAERNKASLDAELKRCEEEYEERVSKEKRKKQRYIKSYLSEFIEDIENKNKKEILTALDSMRDFMFETANLVIQANLSETLKNKSARLERRKQDLDQSVKDKDDSIAKKEAWVNRLLDLSMEVDSKENEINLIEKDTIKQEE